MSQQFSGSNPESMLSSSALVNEVRQCINPLLEVLHVIPAGNAQILTAISNLHQMLEQKLNRIATALEHTKNISPKSTQLNTLVRDDSTNPSVLTHLRDLKNSRYDSVDKHLMNSMKISVYREGLQQSPQQIPHKLHEKIHRTDNDAIKAIKLKQSVQNVELEIEKMQIHQNIHHNKVMKIDTKAQEILQNIEDSNIREKLANNWSSIVLRHEENLKKKWHEKTIFLKSERHMVSLGSFSYATNLSHPQPQRITKANQTKEVYQGNSIATRFPSNNFNNSSCTIDEPMSYSEAARQPTSSSQRIKKALTSIQDQKNVTHIPRPPRPKRLQSRY